MVLSCLIALTVLLVSPLKHLEAVELKEVKLGETVALMCNLSVYFEIHWLKISEGRLMALMVTSLKHTGELSVVWNYNETHFEGFMEMQMTGLRILHVSTSDLATYYCATSYQKRLDFDKGVQLHSKCDISFLVKYGNIFIVILLLIFYLFFAAVLCFGLLVMLLAVSVVHIKTKKHLQH
uniref:Ig-like domain-containing protein n=1 Tax=Cyprinus carpio TaxID=7962 RepID=A0A8C2EXU2_CYPCA